MAFKTCVEILDQTKSKNPFLDWSGVVFEAKRSEKETYEIKKIKRQIEKNLPEVL